MITLGIDPGVDGAVACIGPYGDVTIIDMPVDNLPGSGMVRREVNGWALAQALLRMVPADHVGLCGCEAIHSFPGNRNAPQITFSLGVSVGAIKTALRVCRIETVDVSPQEWKRFFGLDSDKERARHKAIALIPDAAPYLQRKRDHNRAEALLMAHWLLRTRA